MIIYLCNQGEHKNKTPHKRKEIFIMEKKTVVVMSGADVAAMRNAHKEAEAAYFHAKVGALQFAATEMEKTHNEYTLHELCAMTGLTPMEVTVQLSGSYYPCRAAQEAGINARNIRRGEKLTERRFVEVMPNGEINPNSIKTFVRCETTYRIPMEKVYR